jgi:hypothetical protein
MLRQGAFRSEQLIEYSSQNQNLVGNEADAGNERSARSCPPRELSESGAGGFGIEVRARAILETSSDPTSETLTFPQCDAHSDLVSTFHAFL